jgi:hypothetical protein
MAKQSLTPSGEKELELLDALIAADDESAVEDILENDEYVKTLGWWPFGGDDSNFATISNQQTDPVAALAEKPINSIDAVLLQQCKLKGIDPEGPEAPKTMTEAVEAFYGVKDGDISTMEGAKARAMAENIRIIAEGSKEKPNIIVVDTGEGQNPADFKDTLLSLHKKNKARIPFVQGKYGMGGTGVVPFCGSLKYQLVLSKKDPRLLKAGQEDLWGFTLVRKVPPEKLTAQDKHSWYECLTDAKGGILTFKTALLRILPNREGFEHGCYIKLFDYDLESPSFVTTDLWRDLNRRLYSPALPILIQENRTEHFNVTKGKNDTKVLVGNRYRVKKDDRDFVRDSLSINADLGPFGKGLVDVTAFRDYDADGKDLRKRQEWTTAQEAVFMTMNGQTQNTLPRYWLKDRVELESLTDYLLVHVDCTGVPRTVADDVFFGSRDRVRNNDDYREFQGRLASALKENQVLQKLNEEYRQRQLAMIIPDTGIAKKLVAELISKNAALKEYFGLGGDLTFKEPGEDVVTDGSFVGSHIPTFLRPMKKFEGERLVKEMPANAPHSNVLLDTDAEDDYFKREKDAGEFLVTSSDPKASIPVWYLHKGILYLQIFVDAPAVGERFQLRVEATRPAMESRVVGFDLVVTEPRSRQHREPRDFEKEGIKLPELVVVRKELGGDTHTTWEQRSWGPTDVAEVENKTVVYVNMDSEDLQGFLVTCPKRLRGLAETVYKVGIYLNAVVLDMEMAEIESAAREKAFKVAISTVSKTLLPVYLDPRVQQLAEG